MKKIQIIILLFTILIQMSCGINNDSKKITQCFLEYMEIHHNNNDKEVSCPNYNSKTTLFLNIRIQEDIKKLLIINSQENNSLKNINIFFEFNEKLLKTNNNHIIRSLYNAEATLYKIKNDTTHLSKGFLLTIKLNYVFGKSLKNIFQRYSFFYEKNYKINFTDTNQHGDEIEVKNNKNIQVNYYENGIRINKDDPILNDTISYLPLPSQVHPETPH